MDDKIKEIMADILEVDQDSIDEDFDSDRADQWNSLNHLRLIAALEEEFSVRFSMKEVGEMTAFSTIRETIVRLS